MKFLLLSMFAAMSLIAADASGRWSGTMTVNRSDGSERENPALLVLKQAGAKLTGTAGPNADEQHPIENGTVQNGTLKFDLPNGDTVMHFDLKHDGDEIKGNITRERDGQTQTAKLAVKREK
jgi:hypothetical protein